MTTAATEAPASTALEVDRLVRRFGDRDALAGVSFALAEEQTLSVFGPNGAGKTTLLRVLATLLLPHEGSVRVFGHELPREAHAVRSQIGLVGHEPLLYRELTGRENLEFYARLYAIERPAERIAALLEATVMSDRADEPVRLLSRGMAQRLAVCRAVLHEPALLLLDEPRAALDPDAEDLVEPLIGRQSRLTRIVVTHDIERGLEEADRVLGLRDGRVSFSESANDLDPARVRMLYGRTP